MTTLAEAKTSIIDVDDEEWNANELHQVIKDENGRRAKSAVNRFSEGDRVVYEKDGVEHVGTVIDTYRKNVGVDFDAPIRDQDPEYKTRWKIKATALEIIEEEQVA